MNRVFMLVAAIMVIHDATIAQQANNKLNLDDVPVQKNILKASLALCESEETLFWPLYEQYEAQLNTLKQYTLHSLRRWSNKARRTST